MNYNSAFMKYMDLLIDASPSDKILDEISSTHRQAAVHVKILWYILLWSLSYRYFKNRIT